MEFGPVLRKMRKQSGMSQEDMALELHMSISNVSRLESGKYELKAHDMIKWCQVTQMQEVFIAFTCGVDAVSIMQIIMDSGLTFVGAILLGGII
ncbi:hypothetical protein JNUCC1_03317 [Lentibacillus sp. JNUCC-1]|uniref:helix-turn-helix domain-containing protein n=1 Tax=Lentibacillus sp. JNUCC-1 TaxID=2654513 RepID=UPI0012E84D03|nr:helix-turn-helix transcriptional regulator [Lentibacillus sp. JNUCC-1]MUV39439.1 hypothetical protein [Lentibacillus sp. JNUCC-1]